MRVSWRNLDWVGEADRGEIEKKLAAIGGDAALLDRVEFLARDPAQPGAPFEVRITGGVAKNQIAAVRREATAEAAFRSALEAFERSAISVWSARSAAPTRPPIPAPVRAPALPAPAVPVPALRPPPAARPPADAALVARSLPDISIPRLSLSLDRQALFERLAHPTRGVLRAASSRLPQPVLFMRRVRARQSERSRDRDRAEALERMSWRERLATLAVWNEVEAAERWAREQVFARRYRSELEQGEQSEPLIESSSGWRERIADLALWNELEAAERWAREQVMTRMRRGPRELRGDAPARLTAGPRRASRWRARLADLSLWDTLESMELRMRGRSSPRAARAPGGLFTRRSRRFAGANGLVRSAAEVGSRVLRAPLPVRAIALGAAGVVGLWAFQGVSNTEATARGGSPDAAYSAVAVPESWSGTEVPFSAVASALGWEGGAPPSGTAALPASDAPSAVDSQARARAADEVIAYSAVALPDVSLAQQPVDLDDRAALRD